MQNNKTKKHLPLDDETKKQWKAILRYMLDEYRKSNPGDARGDIEIVKSILDHFAETGFVTKKDGKFGLPSINWDPCEL